MNKDQVDGAAKQLKGKVKAIVGDLRGDKVQETKGKLEQVKARAQRKRGDVKERLQGK